MGEKMVISVITKPCFFCIDVIVVICGGVGVFGVVGERKDEHFLRKRGLFPHEGSG